MREEKAKQLKDAASGTFGIGFAKDAFAFQIRQLIEQITFLEKQIKELEQKITTSLHRTSQVITTIPCIGDTLVHHHL